MALNKVQAGGGVIVEEVIENSPAYKAGIKSGDIIISVNDKNIYSYEEVNNLIYSIRTHGIVKIKILRDKSTQFIDVNL